ncbi:MAG TPA: hypothetical protein VN750_15860 [Steroidobacteraceae bacterium]|nr:hypothetical protein [Steroidobacteraceae bacterium]
MCTLISVMRRVLMAVVVICQLLAGVPVSFATAPDPAHDGGMGLTRQDDGMDMTRQDSGMDMTHCPDHAAHQDQSGKHGCCSDAGCQCAVPAALAMALPPVIYRVPAARMTPESDIRTPTLRIDLFLRPPIA